MRQPSNNLAYLAMNVEKKPFDDVRVRRAVAMAIDMPAIIHALYGPGTIDGDNWTPPGMLGENTHIKIWPHDVARGEKLLAQAGFPHGFATTLYLPTSPRPYMPDPQRLAEAIQADLKDAGIKVTLEPLEFGVFLAKVQNGEHPMCLIGWSGDNGDPDNFYYPLLDQDSAVKPFAQNYSFWRDPRVPPADARRPALGRRSGAARDLRAGGATRARSGAGDLAVAHAGAARAAHVAARLRPEPGHRISLRTDDDAGR